MTLPPIHATVLAIDGYGVLLIGPSGCGKSDLALRLIDRGATLVSDDYTALAVSAGTVRAAPPPTIAGKIEVRGLGIVAMPYASDVPVGLIVRLGGAVERMPEPDMRMNLAGVDLPVVALDAFDASTPIKVELALRYARETA